MSQLIGLQGLIVAALFLGGLTQPRTTRFLNILESAEEIVLFAFLEIGFAATGLRTWLQAHRCLRMCSSRSWQQAMQQWRLQLK